MSSQPIGSSWWMGVAVLPVGTVVLWTVAPLVFALLPGGTAPSIPDSFAVLGVLAGLLATGLVFLLTLVSAPLVPTSLYLDAKAVAESPIEWTPNPKLYGALGLVHALVFFFSPVAFFTLALSVFYLYRRHQYVGTP